MHRCFEIRSEVRCPRHSGTVVSRVLAWVRCFVSPSRHCCFPLIASHLLFFLLFSTTAAAQTQPAPGSLDADSVTLVLTPNGGMRLSMRVRPSDGMARDKRLTTIFVPRLIDSLGHQADYPSIALMQPRAYKHHRRYAHRHHPASASVLQLRAGHTKPDYTYTCTLPYADWMLDAKLQLLRVETHCCEAAVTATDTLVSTIGHRRVSERQFVSAHDSVVSKGYKAYIDFPVSQTAIDENYHSNARELQRVEDNIRSVILDTSLVVRSVTFHGYASPEGDYSLNDNLARQRTESMRRYIGQRLSLPDSIVHVRHTAENWEGLRSYVDKSSLPHRQQLLTIIDDMTVEPDAKLHQMQVLFPADMAVIAERCFPQLRYTDYTIDYATQSHRSQATTFSDTLRYMDNGPDRPDIAEKLPVWRPLLALKTNLLFDAALAPNLEVEVPLGTSRWSVMAEWWTPWYRWHGANKGNRAAEVLMVGGELRYWLNRRCHTCRTVLNGHFLGIYGAGGKYDVQWDTDGDNKGWQGEYTSFGLTYGYATTLAPHWQLEFSLGAGYVGGPQRYYHGMFENAHLIWQRNRKLSFIGPTKAKVSIAWIIGRPIGRNGHSKKGGALWQ